ncbi:hypothetical protein FISHEDRAFT_69854 [Fistulina hepatica ATCC 64428]|uniref:DUF6534 domain-containing protein n=1 Tax=Fistulina hepatica ATCC 64428 TaxID=1128425 RepID=A0A0D7AKP0_9AGAR|nr:hypothetical protein FISHEDRAFT_69854 [Fistulina hepatica ATCC 64428]
MSVCSGPTSQSVKHVLNIGTEIRTTGFIGVPLCAGDTSSSSSHTMSRSYPKVRFDENGFSHVWILNFFPVSGHNWLIAVVIISTSLSQSILGLFYMFESLLNNGSERYSFLITPSFALTAAADILITIALTYYLQIRKSGHEATNSVINKIIVSTISNGLLTAYVGISV